MYTTTGLMVEASHVIQKMMGVLSDPEWGSAMLNLGSYASRVALWRMRTESSRSELVSVPTGLVSKTKESVLSDVKGWLHTVVVPDLVGSRHTLPTPTMEVLQNPRWVVYRQKILAK